MYDAPSVSYSMQQARQKVFELSRPMGTTCVEIEDVILVDFECKALGCTHDRIQVDSNRRTESAFEGPTHTSVEAIFHDCLP